MVCDVYQCVIIPAMMMKTTIAMNHYLYFLVSQFYNRLNILDKPLRNVKVSLFSLQKYSRVINGLFRGFGGREVNVTSGAILPIFSSSI